MSTATLTTDFGMRDYASGVLKGALLRHAEGVRLVDISHDIDPYNIVQAAYLVRQVFPEFPAGTVHVVAVHVFYQPAFRLLGFARDGHFFVMPDNGLATLIFPDLKAEAVVELPLPEGVAAFSAFKTAIAHAVGLYFAGEPVEALGQPSGQLQARISLQPVTTPSSIRGAVMHIDHFDNAVINISREVFERVRNGRSFQLYFKRHDPVTRLSASYSDVPEGEPFCLFNAAGYLELGVRLGRGAGLLGLKVEDVVEVLFT